MSHVQKLQFEGNDSCYKGHLKGIKALFPEKEEAQLVQRASDYIAYNPKIKDTFEHVKINVTLIAIDFNKKCKSITDEMKESFELLLPYDIPSKSNTRIWMGTLIGHHILDFPPFEVLHQLYYALINSNIHHALDENNNNENHHYSIVLKIVDEELEIFTLDYHIYDDLNNMTIKHFDKIEKQREQTRMLYNIFDNRHREYSFKQMKIHQDNLNNEIKCSDKTETFASYNQKMTRHVKPTSQKKREKRLKQRTKKREMRAIRKLCEELKDEPTRLYLKPSKVENKSNIEITLRMKEERIAERIARELMESENKKNAKKMQNKRKNIIAKNKRLLKKEEEKMKIVHKKQKLSARENLKIALKEMIYKPIEEKKNAKVLRKRLLEEIHREILRRSFIKDDLERKEIERKEIERKEIERKEIERKEIERKEHERKAIERKAIEEATEKKEIEEAIERKEYERKEHERTEHKRKGIEEVRVKKAKIEGVKTSMISKNSFKLNHIKILEKQLRHQKKEICSYRRQLFNRDQLNQELEKRTLVQDKLNQVLEKRTLVQDKLNRNLENQLFNQHQETQRAWGQCHVIQQQWEMWYASEQYQDSYYPQYVQPQIKCDDVPCRYWPNCVNAQECVYKHKVIIPMEIAKIVIDVAHQVKKTLI
jgi:hypothetical protein